MLIYSIAILSLQYASLAMLVTVFERFEHQRGVILDDFLSVIAKLPASKRQSKVFTIVTSTERADFIRMSTALLLKFVQSCCKQSEDIESEVHEKMYKAAIGNANFFLKSLLAQCMASSDYSKDLIMFLNNLVDDLLLLLHLPEWPGAELLLQMICKALCFSLMSLRGTKGSEKGSSGYFSFQCK